MIAGLATVGLALGWSEQHPVQPSLEIDQERTFRCPTSTIGSYGRHAWVIRNAGAYPLRIRTEFTSGRSGFSLWQGEEHIVEPGVAVTVHLTWLSPSRGSQPYSSYVILRTNDPERPEIRLRIVGITGDGF